MAENNFVIGVALVNGWNHADPIAVKIPEGWMTLDIREFAS